LATGRVLANRLRHTSNRMLAYVFWHWPLPGRDTRSYEAYLAQFHRTLRGGDVPGFQTSTSFLVEALPWTPGLAYEDWYLVEDYTALGRLNDAAVTASRKNPHDAVARAVSGGVGGLYRLHAGAPTATARFATWLSKPRGMDDGTFDRHLQPTVTTGVAVWRRQMVLGPAHEFCILSASAPVIPPALGSGLTMSRRGVF
jgi:hypothetical protein